MQVGRHITHSDGAVTCQREVPGRKYPKILHDGRHQSQRYGSFRSARKIVEITKINSTHQSTRTRIQYANCLPTGATQTEKTALNIFFLKMEFCDQTTWWDVYDSVSLQRQNCWWTAGCLPAALRTTAPSREEDFEVPAAPPKAARAPTSAAGAGGAAAGGTGDPPVREAKALAIMAASIPAFWAVATAAAVPAAAVAAAAGAPLLAPCSADSAPPIECKRHVTTF